MNEESERRIEKTKSEPETPNEDKPRDDRRRAKRNTEDERGKTKEQSEARVIELFTDPGQRRETERGVYGERRGKRDNERRG